MGCGSSAQVPSSGPQVAPKIAPVPKPDSDPSDSMKDLSAVAQQEPLASPAVKAIQLVMERTQTVQVNRPNCQALAQLVEHVGQALAAAGPERIKQLGPSVMETLTQCITSADEVLVKYGAKRWLAHVLTAKTFVDDFNAVRDAIRNVMAQVTFTAGIMPDPKLLGALGNTQLFKPEMEEVVKQLMESTGADSIATAVSSLQASGKQFELAKAFGVEAVAMLEELASATGLLQQLAPNAKDVVAKVAPNVAPVDKPDSDPSDFMESLLKTAQQEPLAGPAVKAIQLVMERSQSVQVNRPNCQALAQLVEHVGQALAAAGPVRIKQLGPSLMETLTQCITSAGEVLAKYGAKRWLAHVLTANTFVDDFNAVREAIKNVMGQVIVTAGMVPDPKLLGALGNTQLFKPEMEEVVKQLMESTGGDSIATAVGSLQASGKQLELAKAFGVEVVAMLEELASAADLLQQLAPSVKAAGQQPDTGKQDKKVDGPAQVMISYRVPETGPVSKGGDETAYKLRDALQAAGYTVFLDASNLEGGVQWDVVIRKGVEGCVVFVPICSATYGMSEWTKAEFDYAIHLKKPVVPVYHSGSWPPSELAMRLISIQYVPKEGSMKDTRVSMQDMVSQLLSSLRTLHVLPAAAAVATPHHVEGGRPAGGNTGEAAGSSPPAPLEQPVVAEVGDRVHASEKQADTGTGPQQQQADSGSPQPGHEVWDLASGQCRATLEGHTSTVAACALTADGRTAVSGSWDNTLKVWDLASGQCRATLEGHTDWVRACALTADGRTAVSGSDDRTIKVWTTDVRAKV